MRLKKLELLGFKSFADKTEIFFDNGVTCIVGPNGCGKSNVSDAIRWVLGERSAKLLRGSSMEDVIFNGTEVRKPLAFAEVALTIDNSDRRIPIEYTEVTIARRLYRTGESEYLLNKTVCRLKDVQDLILDTGIGSSSYSMIEQGRIDYILKADPEERRFLIEEAAGIAKYKTKKDESIRKLERTEENIKRLNDIVFEVQKNIQYAERQAKRAEKYKVELERLKGLEIRRAFFQKNTIETQRTALQTTLDAKKRELTELEFELQTAHAELERQEAALHDLLDRNRQKESERYTVLSQIETNDQKVKFLRDTKLDLAQQRGQVLQEQDQLTQSIAAAHEKNAALDQSLHAQEQELIQAQTRLVEVQQNLERHDGNLASLRDELARIKNGFLEAAQAATQVRNEYHHFKALKENLDQQCRREEAETSRFAAEIAEWDIRLKNAFQSIENKNTDLISADQEIQSTDSDLADRSHQKTAEENQLHQLRLSLKEKEARLHVLTEVDAHQETSFLDFLNESSQNQTDLIQNLKSIFRIADGNEWSLDIALGYFVRSIVVRDVAAAKELALQLKARRSFTAGILVRSIPEVRSLSPELMSFFTQQGFTPLMDLLTITPGWEDFVSGIMGNVFVSTEFPLAMLDALFTTTPGMLFVSKDGFVLTPDRKLYFWNNTNRTEFVFSRQGEVSRLQTETDGLRATVRIAEQTLQNLEQATQDLRVRSQEAHSRKTSLLLERETLETDRKNIEERLLAFQREMDLTKTELQDTVRDAQEALAKGIRFEEDLRAKETEELRIRDLQHQKESELEHSIADREALLLSAQQSQAQFDQCQQGIRHIRESRLMVDQQMRKESDRLIFLADGLRRFDAKEIELNQDEQQCVNLSEQLRLILNETDIALELLKKERTSHEEGIATVHHTIDSAQRRQKDLQEEDHQFSLQLMDLDYQVKNVGERLIQRYRLDLAALNPQDYPYVPEDMANVDAEITQLQTKVDSLGTVNLLAIEEYQELKQRYDFLLAQQKDLLEARDSLMEAIRKINRTTKELFETTFTQVQESFKLYYQTLFRGGEARLFLIDEEHPLESGIDIVVRPPGKKLQNMSLLSGGEKALTAVALLFALFKIRPSPFCLLDEVDAPLDEANIDRFLTVLRSFIETTQFLIITHNRKTIAMGDSLYGVTMEEPGVSKIVSVKVRSGNESLPGEDLHPTVAAEAKAAAVEITDTAAS